VAGSTERGKPVDLKPLHKVASEAASEAPPHEAELDELCVSSQS
jgi:hypothetical protein